MDIFRIYNVRYLLGLGDKWSGACQSRTCDKWHTADPILMKLQRVMLHTALAFSKLLCLAQGGSSNYLANILITSHISLATKGNIQLSMLYKLVSRANTLKHIAFPTVFSSPKPVCFQAFCHFFGLIYRWRGHLYVNCIFSVLKWCKNSKSHM